MPERDFFLGWFLAQDVLQCANLRDFRFEFNSVPQNGAVTPRHVFFAEGLGGHRSEIKGHKDAVRIKLVVTKGAALLKAGTDIERMGRTK